MTAIIQPIPEKSTLLDPSSTDLSQVELKDIIRTIPKECFQKDRRKAWSSVLLSVASVFLGYVAIALSPWFLLPLGWIWTGTALTGFFVIGHDCGHRSFAQRRWVNDLVGHLMMLPLIYPFHSWRLLHDHHHLHTNKMTEDNAWEPWTPEDFDQKSGLVRGFYKAIRGRLWWIGSIAHWGLMHFDLKLFKGRDRNKVRTSVIAVGIFAAIVFPTLLTTIGVWGFVKFWLMPWMFYHFWMSTFTLVHHTDMGVEFRLPEYWSAAQAQLAGTIHCRYPHWVEALCHDINVHVPHHVSVAIPSYNLRKAHKSLMQNWGEHIQQRKFSWSLMKEIGDRCHLYHAEEVYQSFKQAGR